MSGGVDSSVAAALLQRAGHEVVGVTMRLWGGESDTGCCSVSDVDDARRCAQQLGIDHLVFNFSEDFDATSSSRTSRPTPPGARRTRASSAIGAVKFATSRRAGAAARLRRRRHRPPRPDRPDRQRPLRARARRRPGQGPELRRAHARSGRPRPHRVPGRRLRQGRGACASPPSSGCAPPTSPTARTCASSRPPAAAAEFLRRRIAMHAGARRRHGRPLGRHGRRRWSWSPSVSARASACRAAAPKRFVVEVDRATATVVVGDEDELQDDGLAVEQVTWVDGPIDGEVLVQTQRARRAAPRRRRLSPRRPGRRVLAGPAAPGGRRSERRVLRPFRPLRARWRHRHLTGSRPASAQFASVAVSVPDGGATRWKKMR